MADNDTTPEKYPNCRPDQRDIIERYRSFIGGDGGNEPEDLVDRIQSPSGKNLVQTNIIVWAMASGIVTQIDLLRRLEAPGGPLYKAVSGG